MMEDLDHFQDVIQTGYSPKHDFFIIGAGMLDGQPVPNTPIKIPLKTLNRHGLIAGATGTGKTISLQVIAEQLSLKGIPSLLMDLKGDLSGLAQPGNWNEHIGKRCQAISTGFEPTGFPLELLTLSQGQGVQLKATITEFGPILLSQILGLNGTQEGILALVFQYCDHHHLPLLDLDDLKRVLQYLTHEGKKEIQKEYGSISSASVNTIMRKIIELEQQGAQSFFGEISFDVRDLVKTKNGKGLISIIRLTEVQDKPKLFSTFMLSLLSEVYEEFPEVGDIEKPKLCLFIDEAHLVFDHASKDLIEKIESIVKLIRSKGVGIFFCTQSPTDIPEEVLGQLGLKIQHSLRAFTAKDRKSISKTAENFPLSEFYDTSQILTQMGIGEALISTLNEKGIPSPLVHTYMRAPASRMGILNPNEILEIIQTSQLVNKYNEKVNRESALEILDKKITNAEKLVNNGLPKTDNPGKPKESSFFEEFSKNTMVRQIGRTIFRELTRSILGTLSGKRKN